MLNVLYSFTIVLSCIKIQFMVFLIYFPFSVYAICTFMKCKKNKKAYS